MDLNSLQDELRRLPNVELSCTEFESGAVSIDIRRDEQLWVIMISSTGEIGLDEVTDDDGLGTACRHSAANYEDAARKLTELLSR